ncbi:hypothetical protein [Streptomyces niveus]
MDIDGQDIAVDVVPFVGGEGGFDAGDLACLQAASAVDDQAASVHDDGVQQPVFLDVLGEGLEVFLVGRGEQLDGRMEFYGGLLDAETGERYCPYFEADGIRPRPVGPWGYARRYS